MHKLLFVWLSDESKTALDVELQYPAMRDSNDNFGVLFLVDKFTSTDLLELSFNS
jgi:hypothetical protein